MGISEAVASPAIPSSGARTGDIQGPSPPRRSHRTLGMNSAHKYMDKKHDYVSLKQYGLGQRLLSLADASYAEATVKSGYVMLCGDYIPSVKGYYHLLMLAMLRLQ